MPGLSQLKQFNKDIQSLGDEITLRAQRGEKPVVVPIPKGITIEDDSEDFVLGMPDNPKAVDNSSVDEDLSEITGLTSGSSSKKDEGDAAPSFEAPDMSSLLAPVDLGDGGSDDGMPDLSAFADEPVIEEEPEQIEEEPEEISVADMGLDALLAGAGFDGSEGTGEPEPEPEPFEEEEPAVDDLPVDTGEPEEPLPFDITPAKEPFESSAPDPYAIPDIPDIPDTPAFPEEPIEDFGAEPLEDLGAEPADAEPVDAEPLDAEPLEDFDAAPVETFDAPPAEDFETAPVEDFETPAAEDFDTAPVEDFDAPSADDFGADALESLDAEPVEDFDAAPAEDFDAAPAETFDAPPAEDFGAEPIEDLGAEPLEDLDAEPLEDLGAEPLEDLGAEPLEDLGAEPLESLDAEGLESAEAEPVEDFGNEDFGNEDFGNEDFETEETNEPSVSDLFNAGDVELPDMNSALEEIPDDEGAAEGAEGLDDFDTAGDFGEESAEGSEPLETFDTTGMDDMDFGIQDTDAQLSVDTGSDDFELDSGNISMEGSDFEIPGFSDVQSAPATPKPSKKTKGLDEPDFSGAIPGNELPPNTLSDEQYKQFLKNLSEYPLNVRLAFEDLIVQDEFTDDAEFEIIEKILKKAPARQVASTLEKMLDTSIPVPRDFEHRTAEEYEAYKKSLSYQLKNKVLPGILMTALLLLVSWGLFNFTKNCIYIPAKASKLYKQGYALLQADEYVQSQIKFDEAATYQLKKKWFFNFARGYREHKQYQRAADIYGKILIYFNHDKTAGLEYAGMELYDLANYERAEEITRREVLDYHVNDADGILMLGDVFLEWGTEKDPSKLDLAKEQYMLLIQLYKPNDLYNSRLMRYYIRSDNFQQVLSYRKMFEENKKSNLSAEDWTELGGYLLEKLYGPLAPSEEYLRYQIEGLLKLLIKAKDLDETNPIAWYNLGNYYVKTNDSISNIDYSLKKALECFNKAPQLKKRDIYKYIDSYRLLGENYLLTNEYLQAQEQFTQGITLYTTEKENAGFEGNEQIGLLYSDLGNINYTIAGDYETAAKNYKNAVSLGYDNSTIRYRLGYISYRSKNYLEALGSFMKAGEGIKKERNLLLAMANTLSLRNDDYAAEGYYEQLIAELDNEIVEKGGTVFPQTDYAGYDIVTTYLYAANNYGVTLYRLAKRTGNSQKNAQAIVQFQQSLRAWDSLTRDQKTLVRLDGSNLAQENIKYITHPVTEFEPAIYLEIPKNLTENEGL